MRSKLFLLSILLIFTLNHFVYGSNYFPKMPPLSNDSSSLDDTYSCKDRKINEKGKDENI